MPLSKKLTVVPLTAEMLPACAAMAATAPDPWTQDGLRTTQQDLNHWNYAALWGEAPVGFASFLVIAGSADLQQLVVHAGFRRRGVARALLVHALAELCAHQVGRCLLEVRCGNTTAVRLYRRLGFKTLARRPGMYATPREDGYLMAKELRKDDEA